MRLTAGELSVSVDLIVLDKDGTMFDLDETWSRLATVWEDQLERASGIRGLAEEIARRIGHNRTTGAVAFGSVLAAGTMQQLRDAMAEVITDRGGDPALIAGVVVPGGGALTPKGDLLAWLRLVKELGGRVAVLTSDDRSSTLAHLDTAGVAAFVDDLVAGDDEVAPKPDPGGLLALCDRFRVAPTRTVMIGDSPGDMDAAAAAGAYRIGVRADSGDAPAGAQALVAALDEIELAP